MIDIYTNKIDSKDWILQNDLYFNLNTGNEEMSQKEIDLIWQIDEAIPLPERVSEVDGKADQTDLYIIVILSFNGDKRAGLLAL